MQFTFQRLFLCLLVCVEFGEIRRPLLCLLVCGESLSGIRSPVPFVKYDLTGHGYHKTTVNCLKCITPPSTTIGRSKRGVHFGVRRVTNITYLFFCTPLSNTIYLHFLKICAAQIINNFKKRAHI